MFISESNVEELKCPMTQLNSVCKTIRCAVYWPVASPKDDKRKVGVCGLSRDVTALMKGKGDK